MSKLVYALLGLILCRCAADKDAAWREYAIEHDCRQIVGWKCEKPTPEYWIEMKQ